MDCKLARRNIHLYIDNLLSSEDAEPFLKHIHSCPDCYEELEISFIMLEGIRRLDNGGDIAIDFQQELDNRINKELLHFHRSRRKRIYLVILGVCLSLFGITLGHFEQLNHAQEIMQRQILERGERYYYHTTKKYIFGDGMYLPPSLREIIYHEK